MTDENEYLSVDEARALYESSDATHDFDHVLRVTRMAVGTAEDEGADTTVVRLAALLHDIPVSAAETDSGGGRSAHHLTAARRARSLLVERGLGTVQTDNVVHCIEAHRFRDRTIEPQTIEAKCVYDADKLDSMGAIGIARVFAYAGAYGSRLWTTPVVAMPDVEDAPQGDEYTPVHEYAYKLDKLISCLHTKSARRIGKERHTFMSGFFEQLDAEMQAEV